MLETIKQVFLRLVTGQHFAGRRRHILFLFELNTFDRAGLLNVARRRQYLLLRFFALAQVFAGEVARGRLGTQALDLGF